MLPPNSSGEGETVVPSATVLDNNVLDRVLDNNGTVKQQYWKERGCGPFTNS
jgi:hypothetical protein